jgi:hypothetical protein
MAYEFPVYRLSDYIIENDNLDFWDVAIPFGSANEAYELDCATQKLAMKPQLRSIKEDPDMHMLRVSRGTHVKVGAVCLPE